jgi:hypothetical protein
LNQIAFLSNNGGRSVRDIYIDDAGIYWVAIHQGGVNKYDSNLTFFNHKHYNIFDPNGLTGSSVMALPKVQREIFLLVQKAQDSISGIEKQDRFIRINSKKEKLIQLRLLLWEFQEKCFW